MNMTAQDRLNQRDTNQKLANLFGQDKDGLDDDKFEDKRDDVAEPYQDVEEDITTDTTDHELAAEKEPEPVKKQ